MSILGDLDGSIPGAPEGIHVVPRTVEDLALVLKEATATSTPVRVWGGGTKQTFGKPPPRGIVVSTRLLKAVEHWEPDDLTLVVGAGARIADIESMLADRNQTAVLPERAGDDTIGGAVAVGTSSLRRHRLYGLRDRVLEATVVTGDGRIVRSGGRVVKNVSGFDLHRAVVGAFGSLGVVVSICLKLWPIPESSATIRLGDLSEADRLERPLATLQTPEGIDVFLWGTAEEIEKVSGMFPGRSTPGLQWPADPSGPFRWSLRLPPATMPEALNRIGDWRFLALHGVGEIRLGSDTIDGASELRDWAQGLGGALVLTGHPGENPPLDPWGSIPATQALQGRLINEFDPARIINPNRLPGGL